MIVYRLVYWPLRKLPAITYNKGSTKYAIGKVYNTIRGNG